MVMRRFQSVKYAGNVVLLEFALDFCESVLTGEDSTSFVFACRISANGTKTLCDCVRFHLRSICVTQSCNILTTSPQTTVLSCVYSGPGKCLFPILCSSSPS